MTIIVEQRCEKRASELEDRAREIIQSEEHREKVYTDFSKMSSVSSLGNKYQKVKHSSLMHL